MSISKAATYVVFLLLCLANVGVADTDPALAALIAKAHQRCEELQQEKAKIAQASQSHSLSQEQKAQAAKTTAELDKVVASVNRILQNPQFNAGGADHEDARSRVESLLVSGNALASAEESHLGIPPTGPAAHLISSKVNVDGLLTRVSRFDGSASYSNGDGGFTSGGVGSNFFGEPSPVVVAGNYTPTTVQSASAIVKHDGAVEGGVVLEDTAGGLGRVSTVSYDGRFNALVMDGDLVYLMKVPPWDAAALCREIAADKNTLVGVSLGKTAIVFGDHPETYKDTDVAYTLLMTDHFFGDFVFGWRQWTAGYKFPGGYQPQSGHTDTDMLVRFAFKNFHFKREDGELRLDNLVLNATLMPVSAKATATGGMLPDYDALKRGYAPPPAFLANTQFISSHMAYFSQEPIVARTVAYGELAALFRSFKDAGIDLNALTSELSKG